MDHAQARSAATKLYGKRATVQDFGMPSSPEKRAEAKALLDAHRSEHGAHPISAALREQQSKLFARALYYRCRIGRIGGPGGMFNIVEAEGDNFADAIAQCQAKAAAK